MIPRLLGVSQIMKDHNYRRLIIIEILLKTTTRRRIDGFVILGNTLGVDLNSWGYFVTRNNDNDFQHCWGQQQQQQQLT